MQITISSIEAGSRIQWSYCLLAVAKQIEWSFGKTNNFKDEANAHRVHLNGAFLDGITQGHPEEVIPRTVDLTALNGSKEYGTVECKVAPLTLDELRKYHGILPNPNGEEAFEWAVTPLVHALRE